MMNLVSFLQPYDMCPQWSIEVDDNDDFKKEQKRIFRKEDDYQKVNQQFFHTLSIKYCKNLSILVSQ